LFDGVVALVLLLEIFAAKGAALTRGLGAELGVSALSIEEQCSNGVDGRRDTSRHCPDDCSDCRVLCAPIDCAEAPAVASWAPWSGARHSSDRGHLPDQTRNVRRTNARTAAGSSRAPPSVS
jgi:hypothetical protein